MSSTSFIDNALTCKPLQLVRKQAHLGDDNSRYTPVAILSSDSERGTSSSEQQHHNDIFSSLWSGRDNW